MRSIILPIIFVVGLVTISAKEVSHHYRHTPPPPPPPPHVPDFCQVFAESDGVNLSSEYDLVGNYPPPPSLPAPLSLPPLPPLPPKPEPPGIPVVIVAVASGDSLELV
jgi:hypothetical protein